MPAVTLVKPRFCSGVTLFGAVLTYFSYTMWGPWACANIPLLDAYMQLAPFIGPPLFVLAGIAHFTMHEEFCQFYPHQVRKLPVDHKPVRLRLCVGVRSALCPSKWMPSLLAWGVVLSHVRPLCLDNRRNGKHCWTFLVFLLLTIF
jgi:hypothetical protein